MQTRIPPNAGASARRGGKGGAPRSNSPRASKKVKSKGISNRTLGLIAGTLCFLVLVLVVLRVTVLKKDRKDSPGPELALVTPVSETPEPAETKRPDDDATSGTTAIIDTGEAPKPVNVDAFPELKIRSKQLQGNPKDTAFYFTISSDARCMVGDLDIIGKELEHSPESKLLLTIEPLQPTDDGPYVSKEITIAKIAGGVRIPLLLPRSDGLRHMALYVCKDSTGEGRCRDKSVGDLNKVYQAYYPLNGGKPVSDSYRATDKIYFFQYLLLDGDSLVAFDTEATVKESEKLESYLVERTRKTSEAREVVGRVSKMNDTINSVPVAFTGSYIHLDLPRLDQSICAAAGPQPLPEEMVRGPRDVAPDDPLAKP